MPITDVCGVLLAMLEMRTDKAMDRLSRTCQNLVDDIIPRVEKVNIATQQTSVENWNKSMMAFGSRVKDAQNQASPSPTPSSTTQPLNAIVATKIP